jgi:hypothetical protein
MMGLCKQHAVWNLVLVLTCQCCACCFCWPPAASKRVPANQHLSDQQLIGELFAKSQQSGKSHTEK